MGAIARTDIELVEASRRGEHDAFGQLVARYQDVVCAVSYSATGDHGLSEDVAQETFVAAWRQLDRLRDTVRLRPWLCGIARNLGRKAKKRTRREDLVDDDERVAATGTPFDDAARGEIERVVRDALAQIPEAYREALVLYYREDQSIREVATTLGTSEANVMQRLSRGRKYLAESVTALVERSLQGRRPRRDLVAGVLATIAALALPSRVDASPTKGSTMLKLTLAASAAVAVGTTAYLVHAHRAQPSQASRVAALPSLHYGTGKLGLAHAPTLGPTAAPRQIASRSVAAADLGYLPSDSDAVIGVQFAQLRGSALWQRFVGPQLEHVDGIREFVSECGFDPLASLTSVSIGIKGLGKNEDVTGTLVIHGFDKDQATACFDKLVAKDDDHDGSTVTKDGNVVLITDAKTQQHVAFTFLDRSTALVVIGPEAATKTSVERLAAGTGGGIAGSSTLGSVLQYVNTDDSVWFMLSEASPLVAAINQELVSVLPVKLGTTYVAVNVTDTLAIDAGLHLGSPEVVAQLVAAIQARLSERAKQVGSYFDQLDVTSDGGDLIFSAAITGDQLIPLGGYLASQSDVEIKID